MDFDDDWFVILRFETDEARMLEMFNRISQSRPHLIVWLEMETKIGA
jgi:hypothetical protein